MTKLALVQFLLSAKNCSYVCTVRIEQIILLIGWMMDDGRSISNVFGFYDLFGMVLTEEHHL